MMKSSLSFNHHTNYVHCKNLCINILVYIEKRKKNYKDKELILENKLISLNMWKKIVLSWSNILVLISSKHSNPLYQYCKKKKKPKHHLFSEPFIIFTINRVFIHKTLLNILFIHHFK